METEKIAKRVKRVVADSLGTVESDIGDDYHFERDGGADSLDRVELVMAMEEEFEMEVPDEDGEKIETVQQAVDYIKGRLAP